MYQVVAMGRSNILADQFIEKTELCYQTTNHFNKGGDAWLRSTHWVYKNIIASQIYNNS